MNTSISSIQRSDQPCRRLDGKTTLLLTVLLLYAVGAQAQTAHSWSSGFQAFTTNRAVLEELNELDRIAHRLQRDAFDLTQQEVAGQQPSTFTPSAALQKALEAHQAAELQLEIAFGDAWDPWRRGRCFLPGPMKPWPSPGCPHAAVRRGAGPRLHTTVSGLEADRGCAGDILEDRLISEYFDAVAVAPVGFGNSNDAFVILDNFARQVACLGVAQLAELENALYAGSLL